MTKSTISTIAVLGGGSAGFIVALTLKRRLPETVVRVIRSPEIGIIGVGEGTTPYFLTHFHDYLKVSERLFFKEVEPIWKFGIRYQWGPRDFNYTFRPHTDQRLPELSRLAGCYFHEDFTDGELFSSLMDAERGFPAGPGGMPGLMPGYAWHMENRKLVGFLENVARHAGVEIVDATVREVRQNDGGITGLVREDGTVETADLYVDCSGFRSELLGQALGERFISYEDTLFCDRSVVGGWEREEETLQAFTTAQTMDSGWCWRIDHEQIINRGYVYSSAHISDTAAEEEFRLANPKVKSTRVVKYRTGRYDRTWVKNTVAIGNSAGFVEPLEATALMVICNESRALAESLADGPPTPSRRRVYNEFVARYWDDIRDFLAVHYRFNGRLNTPFWQHCRNECVLHGAAGIVEWYQENGPSQIPRNVLLHPQNPFGLEGYYTLLLGQRVPYDGVHQPGAKEEAVLKTHRQQMRAAAARALTVPDCLAAMRSPQWRWGAAAPGPRHFTL